MHQITKSLIILLAVLTMTGCRSARPTVYSETIADSLSISKEFLSATSHDSISLSEESKTVSYERIEFIEGGGYVSLAHDGSVLLSGVAEVKSSRLITSESKMESNSLSEQTKSKESVADRHQETLVSETHTDSSCSKISWRYMAAFVLMTLLILLILIIILKLRRFLFN